MIMPNARHICVVDGCPDPRAHLTVFCATHHARLPAARKQKITYWYTRAAMHLPGARTRFAQIISGTLPLLRTIDTLHRMRDAQRKD